jgi:hypothetical protein
MMTGNSSSQARPPAGRQRAARYVARLTVLVAATAVLGVLSIAVPSQHAEADTSSTQQWATSVSDATSTQPVVGASRTFTFGTSGVTATEQTTAVTGFCVMHQSATTYSGTNVANFTSPTPPGVEGTAVTECVGQGASRTSTITFSTPVVDPVIHVINLDASTLHVSGTSTTGAAIALAPLVKNNDLEITGSTLNSTTQVPVNGGCSANDGSNPSGGCGSIRLTSASGLIKTVTLTETTELNTGDGWEYTLSYPTATLTKAFGPATIHPGATSRLTFTISNAANEAQPTLGRLDFTDTLPVGLELADAAESDNGSCGGPTVTGGGGVLAAGGTSVTARDIAVVAGAVCTITVDVTSHSVADYTNDAASVNTTVANLVPNADATLHVIASSPTVTNSPVDALAYTGTDVYLPGVGALILLTLGAGAVMVGRRRMRADG